MTIKQSLYWDSCVFLRYINNESESSIIEELMRRAESNQINIFTSTITIAEVTHAAQERNQSALNSDVESVLQNLFGPPIKLVDYSITIGYETRNFIRTAMTHSKKIKPIDGIHLTTASWIDRYIVRLDEFNTYDQELKSLYPNIIPIEIIEPHVDQLPLFSNPVP
ncbi:type II toxin-antitoxin system VapC family toxin [Bellilinea sp.]|jgi:predicted nucleic acid-binding protein|uniref:type II toxin-antitoxin system VapC family toxin n=1 Tax=Bellilinea sp. TaxID=2838785 RepID=UPI002ADD7258|nr:PIN domain-containing protein [Bellilinea sp.]